MVAAAASFERTPLGELLVLHRAALSELKAKLADDLATLGQPEYADEVWILRYVLSFNGPTKAAVEAARRAMSWRQDNQALVRSARRREPPSELMADELRAIDECYVAQYDAITQFGEPVFVQRASLCDFRRLMDCVKVDRLELWMNFMNECVWQHCEDETRRRGHFVKQINIQEMTSVPMAQETRFQRALGNSSKTNDWLRPQLIARTIILNAPRWMKMGLGVAGSFMSSQSLSRVWIHSAHADINAVDGESSAKPLCPAARQLLGDKVVLPALLDHRTPQTRCAGELNGLSQEKQSCPLVLRTFQACLPTESPTLTMSSGTTHAPSNSSTSLTKIDLLLSEVRESGVMGSPRSSPASSWVTAEESLDEIDCDQNEVRMRELFVEADALDIRQIVSPQQQERLTLSRRVSGFCSWWRRRCFRSSHGDTRLLDT
eukprot:TRINITY_DN45379_c0_g1_i1.p1 TRINITY_DN45379_c0_g1~~TRINITY_DN45379_c0_g1_i1.p1  ORF type:complete len:457 (-),score=55.36 TRINITY_DN45379_c0_g1_i1:60-1361(-)